MVKESFMKVPEPYVSGEVSLGLQTSIVNWLDERFGLVGMVDAELYRRVPNCATTLHRGLAPAAQWRWSRHALRGAAKPSSSTDRSC